MIKAAAILSQNKEIYSVPQPGRHNDVIALMVGLGHPKPIKGVQGFITEDGVFVNRAEGLKIAQKHKQIVYKNPSYHMLYSEDMW